MLAAGIIFADIHIKQTKELTALRTIASIPFGGRYRLVDFALSNLVNANIAKVGIITKQNYQSLMDHIGSGKDWDLSRRNGGVYIFPPFGHHRSEILYENRLEALQTVMNFINKCHEEHLILMDCDCVNVVDYSKALKEHIKNNADMTIVYRHGEVTEDAKNYMTLEMDDNKRIHAATITSKVGEVASTSINVWIVKRKLLSSLISEAKASGATSLRRDIILPNLNRLRIFGFEHTGLHLHIDSLENYFANNMKLLDPSIRSQIFDNEELPIYTKVRDSAPTKYGFDAQVENSFIAEGCVIEGTVKNSILFRGVKVGKNSVVENAILMQDTNVEDNVNLNYVISDKNVIIRSKQTLSGCKKIPYYIGKNIMV